jgi:hypothetical protein
LWLDLRKDDVQGLEICLGKGLKGIFEFKTVCRAAAAALPGKSLLELWWKSLIQSYI